MCVCVCVCVCVCGCVWRNRKRERDVRISRREAARQIMVAILIFFFPRVGERS
jgi:hypothetical protein